MCCMKIFFYKTCFAEEKNYLLLFLQFYESTVNVSMNIMSSQTVNMINFSGFHCKEIAFHITSNHQTTFFSALSTSVFFKVSNELEVKQWLELTQTIKISFILSFF
jgi:hypothetical protein